MLVAAVFSLIVACTPVEPVKKVLVLGIDGCRPDALLVAETPNIDSLIENGAWAVGQANPITSSGPCWSSIMCGVWTQKHGVTDNGFGGSNYDEYPDFLTLLEKIKPELRTVAVTAGTPIKDRIIQVADYEGPQTGSGDDVTALEVAKELRENDPDVIMVHLDDTDIAGHAYGYHPDNEKYVESIVETDVNVGVILRAMRARPNIENEDWLIIVVSDHGGTGRGHGQAIPEHMDIPFIVSGSAAASEFSVVPKHIDVAPTVLAHLGLDPGPEIDWDGIPVGLKGIDSKALEERRERMQIRIYPEDGFVVGEQEVAVSVIDNDAIARYTTDGSMPTASSPQVLDVLKFSKDTTIRARAFLNGVPVGPSRTASFRVQSEYYPAASPDKVEQGLSYRMVQSSVESVNASLVLLASLHSVAKEGVSATVTHKVAGLEENYLLLFTGFVEVPKDGVYKFVLHSDDGSMLRMDGHTLIDHDGLHGPSSKAGLVALRAGKHEVRIVYFQSGGGQVLSLSMGIRGEEPKELTVSQLSHVAGS